MPKPRRRLAPAAPRRPPPRDRRPASQASRSRARPPRLPPVPRRPMASAIGGSWSMSRRRRRTSAPASTPWRWRSTCATGSRVEVADAPGSLELVGRGRGRRRAADVLETTGSSVALETGPSLGARPGAGRPGIPRPHAEPGARSRAASARRPSATVAGLVAADALDGRRPRPAADAGAVGRDRGPPGQRRRRAARRLRGRRHGRRRVRSGPLRAAAGPRRVLFIPDRPLSTSAMRAALPHEVPLRDAVHNIGARGAGRRRAGRRTAPMSCARRTEDRTPRAVSRRGLPRAAAARWPPLGRPARWAPACRARARRSSPSATPVRGSTQIEAAFLATAAELDLRGHACRWSGRDRRAQSSIESS